MLRSSLVALVPATLILAGLTGCANHHDHHGSAPEHGKPTVFFNLTADPVTDAHSLTMGMQLAGHALDAGRRVVLFFNVRAVATPTVDLDPLAAFHDKPIKELLAGLLKRGVQAHICPHCMKAKEIKKERLVEGVQITTRETLFAELGPNTVVFTY